MNYPITNNFSLKLIFICLNLFCLGCQAVLPVEGSIVGSIHLVGTKIVTSLPFLYFCVTYFNSLSSMPYDEDIISLHYPTHCVCVCMCTPTCTPHVSDSAIVNCFVLSLVGVVQVYFSFT